MMRSIGRNADAMTLQDELDDKLEMTKVTQQELDVILDRHEGFVNNERDGKRMQLCMYVTYRTWIWRAGTCPGPN